MVRVISNKEFILSHSGKLIVFPLYSSYHDRGKYSLYCSSADNMASYISGKRWLGECEVVLVPLNVISGIVNCSVVNNSIFIIDGSSKSKIDVEYTPAKTVNEFCEPIKKYLVETYCQFDK